MMLFHCPEKRWDYQCTKPRKRKNVFALLFLLLYSRLKLSAFDLRWSRLRYPRLRCDWHIDRLALPLCVIIIVAVSSGGLPATEAQNVTTNNIVNYLKDHPRNNNTANAFSTTPDQLLMKRTTELPLGVSTVGAVVNKNNGSMAGSAVGTKPGPDHSHRLRYAQHSAGVYSSQLQHLEDEDDYIDDDDEEESEDGSHNTFPPGHKKRNSTEKGGYIGSPCEFTCSKRLHHVFCDPTTNECTCEKHYPVVIGATKGCAKPKKLGEPCFYAQTCSYSDANSLCVQTHNNAKCECIQGFHSVVHYKPTKRQFCTPDIAQLSSDLPTLLGVTSGIAVLAGLICMVLHLFSKNKYPRHRGHFADTHLPPPILYSSDTGIPLTLQAQSGRPSSRSSLHSSGSIGSYANRRQSQNNYSGTAKGVVVSTSRTGSRRPSLASVHSSSSSIRSYSVMRFEKELQQKEMRHEMKYRLSQLQKNNSAQQLQHIPPPTNMGGSLKHPKPQINVVELPGSTQNLIPSVAPTPSPLTPNSTEELLPMVDETQEEFTSLFSTRPSASYSGPCTPFDGL